MNPCKNVGIIEVQGLLLSRDQCLEDHGRKPSLSTSTPRTVSQKSKKKNVRIYKPNDESHPVWPCVCTLSRTHTLIPRTIKRTWGKNVVHKQLNSFFTSLRQGLLLPSPPPYSLSRFEVPKEEDLPDIRRVTMTTKSGGTSKYGLSNRSRGNSTALTI